MTAFKHLNPNELIALMETATPQIVDIRDELAYASGRIPGAQHLDNSTVQQFVEAADLDAPLVVCCYHGHSSQSAAAFLAERGFEQVYSLDGGFSGWQMLYPDRIEHD